MRAPTPEEQARFRSLRAAYETAFEQWSRRVCLLKSLVARAAPCSPAVQEAQRHEKEAQVACRESRDLLAKFMLRRRPRPVQDG